MNQHHNFKLEISNQPNNSAVGMAVNEKELLLLVKQLNIIYGIAEVKITVRTKEQIQLEVSKY